MADTPTLVTGALGNVGSAVTDGLLAQGLAVRAAGTDADRLPRHPGTDPVFIFRPQGAVWWHSSIRAISARSPAATAPTSPSTWQEGTQILGLACG